MDMRNKNVARPVGTDGTDHAYRQKIVDRYKAAAKARSYLNGVVAMALMYHPLVLLSVFLLGSASVWNPFAFVLDLHRLLFM